MSSVHVAPTVTQDAGAELPGDESESCDWFELRTWALQTARTALRASQRASTLSFQESGAHLRPTSFWTKFEAAHFRLAQSIRAGQIPERLLRALPRPFHTMTVSATAKVATAAAAGAATTAEVSAAPATADENKNLLRCISADHQSHSKDELLRETSGEECLIPKHPFMRHEPCFGACAALACTPEALELFVREDPATHAFAVHIRLVSESLASQHALTFRSLASRVAHDADQVLRGVRVQTETHLHARRTDAADTRKAMFLRRCGRGPRLLPKTEVKSDSDSDSDSASELEHARAHNKRVMEEQKTEKKGGREDARHIDNDGDYDSESDRNDDSRNRIVNESKGNAWQVPATLYASTEIRTRSRRLRERRDSVSSCTSTVSSSTSSESAVSRYSSALAASAMKGCSSEIIVLEQVLAAYAKAMGAFDARFPCLRSLACFLIHSQLWQGLIPISTSESYSFSRINDPHYLLDAISERHARKDDERAAPIDAIRTKQTFGVDNSAHSVPAAETSDDTDLHTDAPRSSVRVHSHLQSQFQLKAPHNSSLSAEDATDSLCRRFPPRTPPPPPPPAAPPPPPPFLFRVEFDMVLDASAARDAQAKGITLIQRRLQGEVPSRVT